MRYEIRETISNRLVTRVSGNNIKSVRAMADGTYRYAVDTRTGKHSFDGVTWLEGDRPADVKPSWSC